MSSFIDSLTGAPDNCTAISSDIFLDIDPTARIESNVLIIVLVVSGAVLVTIIAFFALSRTVRMICTILFDMADLVTDILFIWDMLEKMNYQWAIVSGIVVGFHFFFAFVSLLRDRKWSTAFFSIFQLHICYQAYLVTQSAHETERKERMGALRQMKMFSIALEAIPQTLIQMAIWVSDDYEAGAILYFSLAASLFNATYTLTVADQDMNLFELTFWLFELLSRMATLAIFCVAFQYFAIGGFFVIFITRVIYIRFVTDLRKTNFDFTEDDMRREWNYLRFATMIMSPMIDGFLSIIGNDFVIPYFRRIVVLQFISAYEIAALLVLAAYFGQVQPCGYRKLLWVTPKYRRIVVLQFISAYEIAAMLVLAAYFGQVQPCGYRKLLWVLIAACFLVKCTMLLIQYCCQGGRLKAQSMTATAPSMIRNSRTSKVGTDPSINVEFVDVEMGDMNFTKKGRLSKYGRHSPSPSVSKSEMSASYNSVSKSGGGASTLTQGTPPSTSAPKPTPPRMAPRSKRHASTASLKLSPDSNRSTASRRRSRSRDRRNVTQAKTATPRTSFAGASVNGRASDSSMSSTARGGHGRHRSMPPAPTGAGAGPSVGAGPGAGAGAMGRRPSTDSHQSMSSIGSTNSHSSPMYATASAATMMPVSSRTMYTTTPMASSPMSRTYSRSTALPDTMHTTTSQDLRSAPMDLAFGSLARTQVSTPRVRLSTSSTHGSQRAVSSHTQRVRPRRSRTSQPSSLRSSTSTRSSHR